MSSNGCINVLFTGYAPVHFVCFRPLYERLRRLPAFDVFLSGGLRSTVDGHIHHDERAMYEPFGVPQEHVLSVDQIKERSFDVMFASNTKLIRPKKVDKRIQIFHGISFRNRAVREENMGCDYYFLAGPYMQRKFAQRGLLQPGDPRGLEIGFMKSDQLVNGTLDRFALLERYGLSGDRPVLLYAPTGEKQNSMETMGEDVLRRLRDADRFDVLIKPHDHPKNKRINWFERLAPIENEHLKLVREFDVAPLLFMSDLLISDASSVSSEYSLLDRPMIFLDVPKLIERTKKRKGASVDTDTWGRHAGLLVRTPDEIVKAVDDSLADPDRHSGVRRAMAKDLFFNPGHAVDAATDWLREAFDIPTPTAQPSRAGTA